LSNQLFNNESISILTRISDRSCSNYRAIQHMFAGCRAPMLLVGRSTDCSREGRMDDVKTRGTDRRTVLSLLAAIPATIAVLLHRPGAKKAQPTGKVRGRLTSLNVSPAATPLLKSYPQPHYLPSGYRVVRAITGPKSGFMPASGPLTRVADDQLALLAFHKRWHEPLHIFVKPAGDRELSLAGTRKHDPTGIDLALADGTTVPARYHDGWWAKVDHAVQWDTRSFHSVVFECRGYTVGIRGSRAAGVDFDELVHVAQSVA
jgi:hypothetical protein